MVPRRRMAAGEGRWRPRFSQFGVLAAVLSGAPAPVGAQIVKPGFKNRYYQSPGYMGSRILEHNESGHFSEYVEVTWSQAIALDSEGRIWMADKVNHVIVMVSKDVDPYIDWPAFYVLYAGERGVSNHFDGTRLRARFDSPSGLAVVTVNGKLFIYVADTNNHCIRLLDYDTGRTSTVVGYPKYPGLKDGPGQESRFRSPMGLGIESLGNVLFALDNGRRIRHVQLDLPIPVVTTLVDGACRAVSKWTVYDSIVLRRVGCHSDWRSVDTGDTTVDVYTSNWFCRGHNATCGPRYFPALNDTAEGARADQPQLEYVPAGSRRLSSVAASVL